MKKYRSCISCDGTGIDRIPNNPYIYCQDCKGKGIIEYEMHIDLSKKPDKSVVVEFKYKEES